MKGRSSTIHGKDMVINKIKLKNILDQKGLGYNELHLKIVDKYQLDLTYKGFMTLLANKSSWKLIYAWAIVDVLFLSMEDVFDIIDIDVEQKAKDIEIWKDRYQH